MADCLDDAKFWLPPQFLTDEDFLVDKKSFNQRAASGDGLALGWGPGSGLSSPVDSLLGSLEAESDEEDLFAELSRKMANSTLEDGFKAAYSKMRMLSGSPQSKLYPGWDFLCEAAGEVARLRLSEQLYGLSRSRGGGEALYGAPGRRSPIPVPVKAHNSDGGFNYPHHQHSLSQQQLDANQIQQLKQQLAIMKQQQPPRAISGLNVKPDGGICHADQIRQRKPDSVRVGGTGRPLVAPAASAWPSLQQQNGAGMRAVFLGVPASGKRERAGTGVFLPRRGGSHPETRKKTACSTVLLPDKVVRALNLNLETVSSRPRIQYGSHGCFASQNDCVWNLRRNGVTAQQNWKGHSQPAPPNHEVRLPQEWTY